MGYLFGYPIFFRRMFVDIRKVFLYNSPRIREKWLFAKFDKNLFIFLRFSERNGKDILQ